MRRFPAPPGGAAAGPSTPLRTSRSSEAPMEFEYEQPRDLSESPFVQAAQDGEPARKRTHYDAMEIDTPPRVTHQPPFVPISSNLAPSDVPPADLNFDPDAFSPTQAFALHPAQPNPSRSREPSPQPSSSNQLSVALVDDFEGEDGAALGSGARRPSGSVGGGEGARRRRVSKQRRQHDDDDEEDEGEEAGEMGQLSRMAGKLGGKEFSFQVHHHHAAPAQGGGGVGGGVEGAKEEAKRWLHSGTPYVLLGYLQFSSLLLLSLFLLALIGLLLHTLYHDVQQRLAQLTLQLKADILQCAKSYVDNRCQPETRLPAMARQCALWEECMGQEPVVQGRTRVVAETVAEVVNGFVEVISLRTMLFVSLTLVLTIYGSSVALSLLPSRNRHATHPPPSPYGIGPPHFQHLGPVPPAYYALPPQGYAPQAAGGGWAVGAPGAGGGSPALEGPAGEKEGKKGWF